MDHITIIGGTGTLGSELVKRFYDNEDKYITIISRDEYKQAKMKKDFPHCRYVLADIRDSDFPQQIEEIAEYTDFVFHCAALKHVDLGETNVEQFIKTNLTGTINVFRAFGCHTDIIFFSTDKAVLPINAYGMSKALAEKFLLNATQNCKIYRWGNILGSRGSVISHFAKLLKDGSPVEITNEQMTRFWMTIDDAVDFVIDTYQDYDKRIYIPPKLRSAKIVEVVRVIADIMRIPSYNIKNVGIRAGEKIHECLYSTHSHCVRSDTCEKLTQWELHEMIEPILQKLGYL